MQISATPIFLSAYVSQAAVNLLLAVVLGVLWRRYEQSFLKSWALSWGAFAFFHLGTTGALYCAANGLPVSWRTACSVLAQAGSFMGATLLACGTWELAARRRVERRRVLLCITVAGVAAVSVVWSTLESAPSIRLAVRIGLRAFVVGAAFLGSVWVVWRSRPGSFSWARRLVAFFFLLYGLEQLHYTVTHVLVDVPVQSLLYTLYFLDLDFLLQACVGIGMVMWFFEEERDRAEQASRELIESRDALRQAQRLEAIGRLAGGVAHDFNNLLSVIVGYLELVEREVRESEDARESIEQIRAAAERAEGLTSQLLAFGRRQVLSPVTISLNTVIAGVDQMILKAVGEDVDVRFDIDSDDSLVKVDRSQLDLSILNIALNARDAMPGGGTLQITTGRELVEDGDLEPGTYALLKIMDTGEGMSDEVRSRIFQPFFTTKDPGRGTGLGLSLVYGVVRQSGGDIRVESAEGIGTTFRILLPIVDEVEEVIEAPSVQPRPVGDSERILLVEDTDPIRELAARVLAEAGYEVRSAESGDQACALLETEGFKPDLLLSDVVMPGISGRELARRIRSDHPDLQTLFMSGYPDDFLDDQGLSDAGARFLAKPFSPSKLLVAVRGALDGVEA